MKNNYVDKELNFWVVQKASKLTSGSHPELDVFVRPNLVFIH